MISLLISFVFALLITRAIVNPLKNIKKIVEEIAQGEADLTKRLDIISNDEIGELAKWFNIFLDKLSELIIQISDSAEQVAASGIQMSTSSEDMGNAVQSISGTVGIIAKGSNEQSRDLKMVNQQMSELNSSAEEIASSSQAASEAASNVTENAKRGDQSVIAAVNMMQEIKNSSSRATEAINKLNEEAKMIGSIVSTITSIAEQTNLLALNAKSEKRRVGKE